MITESLLHGQGGTPQQTGRLVFTLRILQCQPGPLRHETAFPRSHYQKLEVLRQ